MIKRITSTWFEVKVRATRVDGDGLVKTKTEAYVVDALSWGEAEKRITEEMMADCTKFDITAMGKPAYKEIFFTDSKRADKYYKCKLQFIVDNNGREDTVNEYYLVQAENIDKAKANIDEAMKGTTVDYNVVSVVETKFLDVFVHEVKEEKKAKPNSATAIGTTATTNSNTTVAEPKKAEDVYNDSVRAEDTQSRKEIPK